MGWLKDNFFALALVTLLGSVALLLVVVGYVGLVVWSALATGAPLVGTLLEIALPTILAIAVLVVLAVVSGVGLGWSILRRASAPRSERLSALAERVEREYSPLRTLGLSETLAPPRPSAEDALADLKRRYVAGELSEAEFERKVDRLVAADSVDEARADRERRTALNDRSKE